MRRDLTGDANERHRIALGVGQRRNDIGHARPGGNEADTCTARESGHALGDEAGGLLVPDEHVADTARAAERFVEWEQSAAWHAGDDVYTPLFQQIDN